MKKFSLQKILESTKDSLPFVKYGDDAEKDGSATIFTRKHLSHGKKYKHEQIDMSASNMSEEIIAEKINDGIVVTIPKEFYY